MPDVFKGHFLPVEAPQFAAAHDLCRIRGEKFADAAIASGNLAAQAVDVNALAVIVVHAEEIILIARGPAQPRADADGRERWPSDEPVGDINVVDVLLDDVVAGHLRPVHPVVGHVAGVRVGRPPWPDAAAGLAPINRSAQNLSELSLLQRQRLSQIAGLMPPLRAGYQRQLFCFRRRGRRQELADARRINRHRFFGKNVFACRHSRRNMHGPERRRRGEDH